MRPTNSARRQSIPSPLGGERVRVRIPPNEISRIEPLNLIELGASVIGRSVAAVPFGASWCSRLPAGEIGSGRRHVYCLVTPFAGCSRWGGLSFGGRPGVRWLASSVKTNISYL